MKTYLSTLVILFFTLTIKSQTIKTDKFELYLNDYQLSEVNIAKGMYMTQNKQFFYEGQVEVNYIDTNKTKMYQFYFSTWDKKYKEFIVKDANFLDISPSFTFIDNNTIKYTNAKGEEITFKLENTTNDEMAILSSMLVWLENFNTEK